MTVAEVVGLTADGLRLVIRIADHTVEVALEDVRRAERRASAAPVPDEPLTPKLIQQRIRRGESAQQVATAGGWPVEVVARYEGPVLAEREHHAAAARRSQVDGRVVEALVAGHLGQRAELVEWDSWLVGEGRWEVRAFAGGQVVRLRWDPAARRVQALDEPARRALQVPADEDDVLAAVLRPMSSTPTAVPAPSPVPRPVRRNRAQVPLWADITSQVTGRDPEPGS